MKHPAERRLANAIKELLDSGVDVHAALNNALDESHYWTSPQHRPFLAYKGRFGKGTVTTFERDGTPVYDYRGGWRRRSSHPGVDMTTTERSTAERDPDRTPDL